MPRIRPYESQVSPTGGIPASGADLSAVGGTGAEQLGQGIVQAGYSAAHAYQILQAQEDSRAITEVHVAYAKLQNEATKQMLEAQANADVNDKNFFNTVYRGGAPEGEEPADESILAQINKTDSQVTNPVAKNVSRQLAASITTNILNQSLNFQTHLAGEYAKSQVTTMTDQLQNTVNADPSQYPVAMGKITDFLKTPLFYGPHMNDVVRDTMKRQMVHQVTGSMVSGMLNNPQNGSLVLNRLDRGDFGETLTGEQQIALRNQAETTVHGLEVEARRAEAEAVRQQKARYDATDQSYGSQFALHQENPGNPAFKPLTATQIGKDLDPFQPGGAKIDGPTGRAWINMIEENARRGPTAVHTNETVERNLFKRIYLPDGDQNKIIDTKPIYDAYLKQQLSDTDMGRLRDEFVKSRSPEGSQFGKEKADFLKGIEPQITKPGPFGIYQDPTTPEKFAGFQRELETTIAQFHKEGKDPRTLFDPNSKDYFGKVAKSSKYQTTGFGSIATPAPAPAPGTPPRKSLDDIFGVTK